MRWRSRLGLLRAGLVLLLVAAPGLSQAAVSFDAAFQDGGTPVASPFAFLSNAPVSGVSGAIGNNPNRVLVAVFRYHGPGTNAGTVSVTWNSVAMTQPNAGGGVLFINEPSSSDSLFVFFLINPATGANVLAATWTGTAGVGVSLGAVSVFNADQTTGVQNYTTNTGTSTSSTLTVNSASGNMVVAGQVDNDASSIGIDNTNSSPPFAAVTWTERDLSGNDAGAYNASTGATTTIALTLGSNKDWAMAGVDVIAAAGGTPAVPTRSLLGVGP